MDEKIIDEATPFNRKAMDLLLENEMGNKIVSVEEQTYGNAVAGGKTEDLERAFKRLQKSMTRHQSTREMNRRLKQNKK